MEIVSIWRYLIIQFVFGGGYGLEGLKENMFWKDRDREHKELNGGPLCGQVRVLVVGDSGDFLFLLLFFF